MSSDADSPENTSSFDQLAWLAVLQGLISIHLSAYQCLTFVQCHRHGSTLASETNRKSTMIHNYKQNVIFNVNVLYIHEYMWLNECIIIQCITTNIWFSLYNDTHTISHKKKSPSVHQYSLKSIQDQRSSSDVSCLAQIGEEQSKLYPVESHSYN